MSYGLKVIGASGQVQISDLASSFSVVKQGVVGSPVTHASLSQLANASAQESLFIKPAAGYGGIGWRDYYDLQYIECSTGSISYCVIKPNKLITPSSAGYGIRSFGPSGELLFDSGTIGPKPLAASYITYQGGNVNTWYTSSSVNLPNPLYGRNRFVDFSCLVMVHRFVGQQSGGASIYTYINFNSQSSLTFGTAHKRSQESMPGSTSSRTAPIYFFIMEI